ncbi:DNA alkylation repair protein [Novipirellula caenicola]|uniref:DNA alkylation repair enzyme n=1 Tax=Novipirellula caenicola TaxID=1536901 RepID=A0ABP9VLQ4_9BACT
MNPTYDDVMAELESLGSAQTRKTYLRHGASEPLFGVKFGDLRPLQKRHRGDQQLAELLIESGNSDAMTLALLIADPNLIRSRQIDDWLKQMHYSLLVGMLADLASRTSFAAAKWKKWSQSRQERSLAAGYTLLASWMVHDSASVPVEFVEAALEQIETTIHDKPNQARHAMNQALISIGICLPAYHDRAIRVAKAIGKVSVDHGETSCKTPDAAAYIERALKSPRRKRPC